MTKQADPKLLEILYAALAEPVGLTVRTNSVEKLRQKLYVIRAEFADLQCLSFSPSPVEPETELWIVKK